MNWKVAAVAAAACALALASCSTPYQISLEPLENQRDSFLSGTRLVDSEQSMTAVRVIPPSNTVQRRGALTVVVFNKNGAPFHFGTESIYAELDDGSPVHVFSYAELAEEERRRRTWEAVAWAFSAAGNSVQAANAGYSTSYTSYSGNTYGTFGTIPFSANTYGSGITTTYDAGKAQIAQSLANQENRANLEAIQEAQQNRQAELEQVIRTTTVNPGGSFGGEIQFELPKNGGLFNLVVAAGSELHTFFVSVHRPGAAPAVRSTTPAIARNVAATRNRDPETARRASFPAWPAVTSGTGPGVATQTAMSVKPNLRVRGGSVTRNQSGPSIYLPDPYGAWIDDAEPDGPASKAGIRRADIVRTFNGHRVETFEELEAYAAETVPGTRVRLGVFRNREMITVEVDL